VNVSRRVVAVLAKVRANVRSGNPANQIVIDGGDVQKIFGKGPLVFLYFEIVLVFRKTPGHGDKLIADLVPPLEGFVRPRTRGTRELILRLALAVKTCSGEGKQSKCNKRKRRPPHHKFLLWIDQFSETRRCPVLLVSASRACASMRRKVISNLVAALHHEANALEFGDVGDRISRNGNEIGEFAGFNRA